MLRRFWTNSALAREVLLDRRYTILCALYLVAQVLLVVVCLVAYSVSDTTRAFATGEALFSKAQKLSVMHLIAYTHSGDTRELQAFELQLHTAMGARVARLALQQTRPDLDRARQGFAQLGLNATDGWKMTSAFNAFQFVAPVHDAILIWAQADPLLLSLRDEAKSLRVANAKRMQWYERQLLLNRIRRTDNQLTALEQAFGEKLATINERAVWIFTATVLLSVSFVSWIVVSLILRPMASALSSEAKARANEFRFRDFTEIASDCFLELDHDLTVTDLCGRVESEVVFSRKRLVGRNWPDLLEFFKVSVSPSDHLEYLRSRREFRDHTFGWRNQHGIDVVWSASGRPVFDKTGNVCGFRMTCRDVTDATNASKKLAAAHSAAENASIAKSNFLANMSHELRTPLNAIIGFSELIESEAFGPISPPKYVDYATDIRSSGQHLLHIITDILDLAKIESGKFEVVREPSSLAEIFKCCQSICDGRAAMAGVKLAFQVSPTFPLIAVDALRIKQVLINLIANAIRFTPSGGSVVVMALDEVSRVSICVTDTGIGMTGNQIEVALSPFGQATGDADKRRTGTGLGLPIAKALVELHGGEFLIESAPGAGTTVRICLATHRVSADQKLLAAMAG